MSATVIPAAAQVEPLALPPVKCLPNSPERKGQEGCSILAARPLVVDGGSTLYWHLDRFSNLSAAQHAAGPNGVAQMAHGSSWLMTVEPRHDRQHSGRHIAWIGPLSVPSGMPLTMRVQSSLLRPRA